MGALMTSIITGNVFKRLAQFPFSRARKSQKVREFHPTHDSRDLDEKDDPVIECMTNDHTINIYNKKVQGLPASSGINTAIAELPIEASTYAAEPHGQRQCKYLLDHPRTCSSRVESVIDLAAVADSESESNIEIFNFSPSEKQSQLHNSQHQRRFFDPGVITHVENQLNTILHIRAKIRNRQHNNRILKIGRDDIKKLAEEIDFEIWDYGDEISQELEEDRIELAQWLDLGKRFDVEIGSLNQKIERNEARLLTVQEEFFEEWKAELERQSLLRVPSDTSAGSLDQEELVEKRFERRRRPTKITERASSQSGDGQRISFQLSEKFRLQKEIEEAEMELQDAYEILEQWDFHYKKREGRYLERVGLSEATFDRRTLFDVALLKQKFDVTSRLGEAERKLQNLEEQARELGIKFRWPDQTSNFGSYTDDGYRESQEADLVKNVDRDWIETWLESGKNEKEWSRDCDDWHAKSLEIGESVSVVAVGKERKLIDRWKTSCAEIGEKIKA